MGFFVHFVAVFVCVFFVPVLEFYSINSLLIGIALPVTGERLQWLIKQCYYPVLALFICMQCILFLPIVVQKVYNNCKFCLGSWENTACSSLIRDLLHA